MPWQRRDVIQFCILLLCVPLQYYVSGYFLDVKDADRSQIIISIMKTVDSLKEKLFNFDVWTQNWHYLMIQAFYPDAVPDNANEDGDDNNGDDNNGEFDDVDNVDNLDEVHIVDVDHYDLISKMTAVKDVRPDNLMYRIGQTVQMNSLAYRGVIVGWDYDKEVSEEPIYQVLIDESHVNKDIVSAVIEVPQDKLYLIRNFQVTHKYLKRYFSVYDGMQYVPKEWLKTLYPRD